jgi:hypothetical protein
MAALYLWQGIRGMPLPIPHLPVLADGAMFHKGMTACGWAI